MHGISTETNSIIVEQIRRRLAQEHGGATIACIWKYPTNFFVTRFDLVDGSKQFRPFHNDKPGQPREPRPFCRIDDLPDRGRILVVEAERGMAQAILFGTIVA